MTTKNILFFTFLVLFTAIASIASSYASQSPVAMQSTADFGVLAATAITNTGPTLITKNMGLSPNGDSSITGFFVIDSGPGIVNGQIHAANSIAAQAKLDLVAAYNDAALRSLGVVIVPSGELGGLSLTPGLYRSGISSFAISSGDLILDAQGNASAVFIFQMPSSSLTTISGRKVILTGNADPCNIYWQVGSSAVLGTNSTFKGNILALTSITATTGANLEGRALARNGAVTLDTNNVFLSCANATPINATPINSTNQTNSTNSTNTCFLRLKDIPAVCIGGVITQNTDLKTYDNCRHIICANGTNLLRIIACEKPDEINPTYFEMYKTNQSGTKIKICLGSACILKNGFAKQNFPVCTGNNTSQTTPSVNPANTTNTSVALSIARWFPQGKNYVFNCIATGFTPTSYDWIFGDGQKLLNYNKNNVYHTFANGTYTVKCTAKSPQTGKSTNITISV